ncbi:MAG: hypothetical protein ACK5N8_02940 [Alphaproteobacteria bacterium]
MRRFYLIRPALLAVKLRNYRKFDVIGYKPFYDHLSSKVFWILTLRDILGFNRKDIYLYVPFSCEFVEQIIYELQCGNDELLRFVRTEDFEDAHEVKVSEINPTKPLEEKGNSYQVNSAPDKIYVFTFEAVKFALHWFAGELVVSFISADEDEAFGLAYANFLAIENEKFE